LKKLKYWQRIFNAYVLKRTSQLSFWHGEPIINEKIDSISVGQYYMLFHHKAEYDDLLDRQGIPVLNYHGDIGNQYNPIAIAQWGLGNYNIWHETKSTHHFKKFIKCADWLVDNLEKNSNGYKVWMHHFDFEYRDTLKAPWYSGLAQGQGISVLIRALKETNNPIYKQAAVEAIKVFDVGIDFGGVNYVDPDGNHWIEEYIVHPPTHILNGFIWGLWGLYDYGIYLKDEKVLSQFENYIKTLEKNLDTYDTGFWSLYEHSGTWLGMIASTFYHKLHIVQLKVLFELTNKNIFSKTAKKWESYLNSSFNKKRALFQKVIFKVVHY